MKLKYITGTFILAVFLSACDLMNGIDNVQPQYQLQDDNYVTDRKSAELALNGVYQYWRGAGIGPFRVHMSVLAGSVAPSDNVYGIEGCAENDFAPDNEVLDQLYSQLYTIINAANYLIEVLESDKPVIGLNATRKAEIIGECKFHRAMAHFILLRQFGQFYDESSIYGIVLRKAPYIPVTPIAARDKVADCYTFILEDLTAAGNNAPEMAAPHCRVTRLTAKALKARVLLYQKKYPEAATLALEVLEKANTYGYSMEEQWKEIFQGFYESSETLFAPYTMGIVETCDIELRATKIGTYTSELSETWAPKFDASATDDPRIKETFKDPDPRVENGKYPYITRAEDIIGNGHIFLRLAEVYLIHAEAEARQGASHYAAARKSLKTITDRAGYPENTVENIPDNELLEAIRQHKWMELAIENGEEWFDLVRYTQTGDLPWGSVKGSLEKEWQLIAPIPKKALSGNKLLVQNPEY